MTVNLAQWEGLDQSKFLRVRIRVIPKKGSSLLAVGDSICHLLSTGLSSVGNDNLEAYLLGEPSGNIIDIAFPADLSPPRLGVTQILNVLTLPSEYNYADSIIIENVQVYSNNLSEYVGPQFGVEGLRAKLKVPNGPPLGAILKPRLCENIDDMIQAIRGLGKAGIDFVTDDELVVDLDSSRFSDRVPLVIEALHDTGSDNSASFIANVTARPSIALELADAACKFGAAGIVSNPIVTGFGALEDLAENGPKLPIFATNIGAAILAKELGARSNAGFSEPFITKLTRLAGADAIHCGISAADWYGNSPPTGSVSMLDAQLGPIRNCFRVIAGGLNVVNLISNWPYDGENVIFEAGSSIFEHPGGPLKGATALRTAWEIATDQDGSAPEAHLIALAQLLKRGETNELIRQALEAANWVPDEQVKNLSKSVPTPTRFSIFGNMGSKKT